MVRETGFEPVVFLVWEILSLLRFSNFATLAYLVPQYGIEPSSDAYKATVIPIYYKGRLCCKQLLQSICRVTGGKSVWLNHWNNITSTANVTNSLLDYAT